MGRMRMTRPAALAAAASLLILATCSNPVNLVTKVEQEVMKANDRYLEVESFTIPLQVDSTFSPTGTISIKFDRPIDVSSVSNSTVVLKTEAGVVFEYPLSGVSYIPETNILRIRAYPYLAAATNYILHVEGVRGEDGSEILDVPDQSFATSGMTAGSLVVTGADAKSLSGYSVTTSVNVRMTVNDFNRYIKYRIDHSVDDGDSWIEGIQSTLMDRMYIVDGVIDVSNVSLAGVADGPVLVRAMFWGNNDGSGTVNEGLPDEHEIYVDTVAPTSGAIEANAAAGYTNDPILALAFSTAPTDTDSGVVQMRFSNDDGTTWSDWETYSAAKSWDLSTGAGGTSTEGSRTVSAQVRDAAGNISDVADDDIVYDSTAPAGGLWSVNGGATYTTLPVLATIAATTAPTDAVSGVASMSFSNDGATWSDWETYAASKSSWNIVSGPGGSSTEGTRSVYVRIRDNAGNISSSVGDNIVYDATLPSGGAWTINSGAAYTTSTSVTLTPSTDPSDSLSGIASMMFSNDGTTWSLFEAYAASKTWTLSGSEGSCVVYVRVRDGAGNVSVAVSDGIVYDVSAPNAGTWIIDAGATYTTDETVALTPTTAPDDTYSTVVQMRFSNDGTLWSDWESYAATKSWSLTDTATGGSMTQGGRTVYVQVKDGAGNESSSTSDGIFLDYNPPSAGTWTIDAGATYATSADVALTYTTSPSDLESGLYQMRFSNDNSTWSEWETYAATKSWSLTSGAGGSTAQGTRIVYIQVSDRAGNPSSVTADSISYDVSAPSAGAWTINSGATYSNSATVTLTPTTVPTDNSSGVYQMSFSNDNSTWSDWEAYAATKSWSLTGGAGGTTTQGTRTVYVKVRDNALIESSDTSDSIYYDVTAPSVGVWRINAGATYTSNATVTLAPTTAPSDTLSGVYQMRFSNDAGTTWSAWESYAASKSWSLTGGAGGSATQGYRTVYVQVVDNSGNLSSTTNDEIYYDVTAPSAGVWTINAGATYSNSATVTLTPTTAPSDAVSGIASMRFSNNASSWSDWESYAASKSWSLTNTTYGGSTTQGSRYVYVQVQDGAGNISSYTYDYITYDTSAPSPGGWTINSGATYSNSATVTLTATTAPSDGYSGVTYVQFSNNASSWYQVAYTSGMSVSWSLTNTTYGGSTTQGTRYVYVRAVDGAGNTSGYTYDYITYDTSVTSVGAWTINSGATYSNSATVTLTATTAPSDSLSGISYVQLSNNASSWYQVAYTSGMSVSWSLTNTTYGGSTTEGTRYVYVRVVDGAGNTSGYTYDYITYDVTAPVAATITAPTSTTDRTPTWTWTWGSGTDYGRIYVYSYVTSSYLVSALDTATTTTSYTYTTNLADGNYRLMLYEYDNAGNYTYNSSLFVLDGVPGNPTISATTPTVDPTPTWSWSSGGFGSGTYQYKLYNNTTSSIIVDWTTTTATSYTPPALDYSNTYRLYVKEMDADEDYSPDTVYKSVAVVPCLPISGSTVTTLYPTVQWCPVARYRLTYYAVQVSLNGTTWANLATGLSTNTYTTTTKLTAGTRYYWRIQYTNLLGNTAYFPSTGSFNFITP